MYHQVPRPRFPHGNMPRFPAPPGQQQGPGWMRDPWHQRFVPPRPDTNQHFQPPNKQYNGSQMGMTWEEARHGPRFNFPPRPPGPRSFPPRPPGPCPPRPNNDPMFRPYHNGPPLPRHGCGLPNFPRHQGPNNFQQRPKLNNNHGQPQGNKQPKVDKRDLPENNRYYCDSCDRGFKDEDKYKAHTDTHEKCPEPGCTYVAAGRLVQLHIKLQHRAGLAKKIWSLETPEDIKKWREDRKRNFPTAETIARKNASQVEKIARGEVIEDKYFGKMRNRGRGNHHGRGRGRGRGRGIGQPHDDRQQVDHKRKLPGGEDQGRENADCTPQKQLKTESIDTLPATDSLGVFFGSGNSDEDSEMDSEAGQTSSRASPVTAAGALGNLIMSYQDSSGEEEGDVKDENQNKVSDTGAVEKPKVELKEKKREKRDYLPRNNRNNKNRKKNKMRNRDHPVPMVNKSLLEKLLAKEIRQERNKILQCVHYIVKHRFFEKSVAESVKIAS